MSTLIAFKWAVLYENVICTATFFSYLNVVRKWEAKMNCCFYWSWKPSSCWSNETGNDSLSKTITQPHFFFIDYSWKQGWEKKKQSKQTWKFPRPQSWDHRKRVNLGKGWEYVGWNGIWNSQQEMNSAAFWSPPCCTNLGREPFLNSLWTRSRAAVCDKLKSRLDDLFFFYIFLDIHICHKSDQIKAGATQRMA